MDILSELNTEWIINKLKIFVYFYFLICYCKFSFYGTLKLTEGYTKHTTNKLLQFLISLLITIFVSFFWLIVLTLVFSDFKWYIDLMVVSGVVLSLYCLREVYQYVYLDDDISLLKDVRDKSKSKLNKFKET